MSAIRPQGPAALGAPAPRDPRVQLRRMAHEFEALFLQEMFRAMRASLPRESATAASAGADVFTQMLDERVASLAARQSTRGLGEAIVRQMSRRLDGDAGAAAPAAEPRGPMPLATPGPRPLDAPAERKDD